MDDENEFLTARPEERDIIAKKSLRSSPVVRIHRHTSLINNERLQAEEYIENNFLLLHDFLLDVADLQTNIASATTNRVQRYTPDARVVYRSDLRMEYIEIKSDEALQDEKFLARWERIVADFTAADVSIRLVTKSQMPSEAHFTNLKRFYMARTAAKPSDREMQAAYDAIPPGQGATLDEASALLSTQRLTVRAVWHHLAHGTLKADMEKIIGPTSIIERA